MLKHDIGLNAGNVYTLLSQRGRLSLRKIGELTKKSEYFIFLAMGWLLRENKIDVFEHNGELFFELKNARDELS